MATLGRLLYPFALFLALTLSSIATPLAERLGEAHLNNPLLLPRDGVQTYCQFTPWGTIATHLKYPQSQVSDTTSQDRVIIITLETSAGGVLCVIGPDDIAKMWTTTLVINQFDSLFLQGLLGSQGKLTGALNQLKAWQEKADLDNCGTLGQLQIFAAQVVAPSIHATTLTRQGLVTAIASIISLLGFLGGRNPNLAVPIYSFDSSTKYLPSSWKAAMSQGIVVPTDQQAYSADIRVGYRGLWNFQPQNGVGVIKMNDGRLYEGLNDLEILVFQTAEVSYEQGAMMSMKADLDQLTWTDLTIEGYSNALNARQLTYSEENPSQCQYILWSRSGALLGFMNNHGDSTIITLTSIGAVICYVPMLTPRAYSEKSLQPNILDPLANALKLLNDERAPNSAHMTIYGTRIWFTSTQKSAIPKTVLKFLAWLNVNLPLSVRRRMVVNSDSNLEIMESHVDDRSFKNRFKSDTATAWVSVFQEPPADNGKPRVLLMEMLGAKQVLPEDAIPSFQYVVNGRV